MSSSASRTAATAHAEQSSTNARIAPASRSKATARGAKGREPTKGKGSKN